MTPRQTDRHVRAAIRRQERVDLNMRWAVWHVAVLSKTQKKFPSFDEFVRPPAPTSRGQRRQTTDEQIAAFKGLMERRRRGKPKG